jgi:hypothetical protein
VLPVKRPGTSLGRKQVESDRVPCSGRRDKGGQGRDGFYNDDGVGEREKQERGEKRGWRRKRGGRRLKKKDDQFVSP